MVKIYVAEMCMEVVKRLQLNENSITEHNNKIDNLGEMSIKDNIEYSKKAEKRLLEHIIGLSKIGEGFISIKDLAFDLNMTEDSVTDYLELNGFILE